MKTKIFSIAIFLIVAGITFLGATNLSDETPEISLIVYCKNTDCSTNLGYALVKIYKNGDPYTEGRADQNGTYGTGIQTNCTVMIVISKDGNDGCKNNIQIGESNHYETVCLGTECGDRR